MLQLQKTTKLQVTRIKTWLLMLYNIYEANYTFTAIIQSHA